MKKEITLLLVFALLTSFCSYSQIEELQDWLAINANNRPNLELLDFSKIAITNSQADEVVDLLLADKQAQILDTYVAQWEERVLNYDNYLMPFFYQIFGNRPASGRSLYISLHGGGGTTAAANNQQYENQKRLYDATMNNLEGVYMAMRAPTNTWNLWHQSHIDEFLNLIIQMAVIKEGVDPNKVYILGYSAGGDGVYKLGPRLADRWAAASMMAGHPNDGSPYSLMNTPFAIHMGALDTAFNRNTIAAEWGVMLDDLQANNPQGYKHDVQIYEGLGHWMNLRDAVALPWMSNYTRNPVPNKVAWKQDAQHHSNFYWLEVPEEHIESYGEVLVEYNSVQNEINILENYSSIIKLNINDSMINLDNPVTVKFKGNVIFNGLLNRTIQNIYNSITYKGDRNLAFSAVATVENNQRVLEENIALSLDNVEEAFVKLEVFPNPVKSYININLSNKAFKTATVSIFDLHGRKVASYNMEYQTKKINLSNLLSGAYFIKLETDNDTFTTKIIKS